MENLAEIMEYRNRSLEALKKVQDILDERVKKNNKQTKLWKRK